MIENCKEEILSVVKTIMINGVKSLDGYNNPFRGVAEVILKEHEKEIKEIMQDCLNDILSNGEFKAEIRQAIGQKVVREFANQSESCIARTVQKLKQDETFRARLTIAVDNLLKDYEK